MAKRGRPAKKVGLFESKKLIEKSNSYFNLCNSRTTKKFVDGDFIDVPKPMPYTVEGLCNVLGVTAANFRLWCKRDDDFGQLCLMLRQKICENRVVGALDGDQNPAFAKFMLGVQEPAEYTEKVVVEGSVSESLLSILQGMSKESLSPGE